ncbi:hypothetical protein [Vogesella sp. AC12]|uniref:hypothetical protein n=1 Tax=Vogesella sp. AC12 TaxID=2950550 RepID=UPI00210D6F6F|nr:hypothetical protein [Vogesella sp. AC12]MCQ4142852.1 hypothetical protein [Vogesella sp. AC12]
MPRYFFTAVPQGFYRDDFHQIPEGAVEIAEPLYAQLALTPIPSGQLITQDSQGQPQLSALPPPLPEALRALRLVEINAMASVALSTLSTAYPDGEVASWPQQTREAEALEVDQFASTPLLSEIAAVRGLPVLELAARVRAKVLAYAVASGQIIGQRQALEDALMAVDLLAQDAVEQMEAIQWPAA